MGVAALLRRAVLDGLVHPRFQAELPERVRADVGYKVGKTAGEGNYGRITLGSGATEVRAAAQRLKSESRVPHKLAGVLGELSKVPGY